MPRTCSSSNGLLLVITALGLLACPALAQPTLDGSAPPARASGYTPCPDEDQLRSVHSRTPTTITFENRGRSAIRIYWLDYDGRRQHRATVQPGATRSQKTYVTHPWIITRSNNAATETCHRIVMPDPGGRTVTVN